MISLKVGDTVEFEGQEYQILTFQTVLDYRGSRRLTVDCHDPFTAQRLMDEEEQRRATLANQKRMGTLIPKLEKVVDEGLDKDDDA